MKKLAIITIILCTFALTGCVSLNALLSTHDINIDKKGVEVLQYADSGKYFYYKDGVRYPINVGLDVSYDYYRDMFFVDDQLGAMVTLNHIIYFNLSDLKVARTVDVENLLFVGPIDGSKNLYVFAGDCLYEYDYAQNKLTKLKQFENAKDYSPKSTTRLEYCSERKSLFFTSYGTDGVGIYELNLETYAIDLRFKGEAIDYVGEENRLYFIGEDLKTIKYADINTLTESELFKSKNDLYNISVISKDIMLVSRASSGSVYSQTDMLLGGKLYYPLSRYNYNNSAIPAIRISDSVEAEWMAQYAPK